VGDADSIDESKSKWVQVQQGGRQGTYSVTGLQSGYYILLAWKDVDGDREVSYNDYLGIYTDSNGNIQLVTPGRSGVNITMEVAYAYASVQGLPGSPPLGALPNLLPGTR
jgi:serine protease